MVKNDLFDHLLFLIHKQFGFHEDLDSKERIELIALKIMEGINQRQQSGIAPDFSEENIRWARETIARATKPGATGVDQAMARLAKAVYWDAL